MVDVSAARQGQLLFWCCTALLAAGAIIIVAGDASWPQWLILFGSSLTMLSEWMRPGKPKTVDFLITTGAGITLIAAIFAMRH